MMSRAVATMLAISMWLERVRRPLDDEHYEVRVARVHKEGEDVVILYKGDIKGAIEFMK